MNNQFPTEKIDMFEAFSEKTPIQKELEAIPIMNKILSLIPSISLKIIKKHEYIENGREEELLIKKDNGKEIYKDPSISLEEECVYISRWLFSAANKAGSGFLMMNGYPYYYTGQLWEKLSDDYAREFITLAALKSGFFISKANRFDVKKKLYNQLMSDYNKPENVKYKGKQPILINLLNGTLEFKDNDFIFRDFKKEDYLTYQLQYEYDPDAKCPQFDKFLNEVLPDKNAQDALLEMIGYCFIPTEMLGLERSLMLYGPGANGKGVVFNLIVAILGEEHVSGYSMNALSFNPNARAQLADKLLNYATEIDGKISADMLKKLISGEPVEVKSLYKDMTMMKNYNCKFIFNANNLPRGAENTNAFFRRWLILPFDVIIDAEKRDVHLVKKLKTELSGILNRVLEGIKRLIANEDFTESELSTRMLNEYKSKVNSVRRFIEEESWVPSADPKETTNVSSEIPHVDCRKFYKHYCEFCKETNSTPVTERDFRNKIREFFCVQTGRTANATWVFAKQVIDLDDTILNGSDNNKNDDNVNMEDIKPIKIY